MAPEEPACRILLIGMMGSGKTTIGRLLSAETAWSYVDNDELLRRGHGMTARELLASGGESTLREAEASALGLGVTLPPPVIVGVAAGTIVEPRHRELLRTGGIVVWLRADVATLVGRAAEAEHRPFVEDGAGRWLASAVADREPLYQAVADLVVQTDSLTPGEAVTAIRDHITTVPNCRDARTS